MQALSPAETARTDSTARERTDRIRQTLTANPGLAAGLLILLLLLVLSLLAPAFTHYTPVATDPAAQLVAPSAAHRFGTDEYGRDILARVLYAARLDFLIAVAVTGLALVVGALIGAVAGFYGGWVDVAISRVVDVLMAFPSFILAMGVTAMLGNKTINVVIALAVAYMPFFIRLTRAEMLALRSAEYADAARCIGASPLRIMLIHLLPNALRPALTQATLTLGWGILDAAGLSFLGLGIKPPTPEWGVMIGEGVQNIFSGQWWTSFFPGAAVFLAVVSFNLIADGLSDAGEAE